MDSWRSLSQWWWSCDGAAGCRKHWWNCGMALHKWRHIKWATRLGKTWCNGTALRWNITKVLRKNVYIVYQNFFFLNDINKQFWKTIYQSVINLVHSPRLSNVVEMVMIGMMSCFLQLVYHIAKWDTMDGPPGLHSCTTVALFLGFQNCYMLETGQLQLKLTYNGYWNLYIRTHNCKKNLTKTLHATFTVFTLGSSYSKLQIIQSFLNMLE